MPEYRFERDCRTPYSEAYLILDDGQQIGRLDIHFSFEAVVGTMVVPERFTRGDIDDIIQMIDQDMVNSTGVARSDFILNVYAGRLVGTFTDDDLEEEEESTNGLGP